MPAPHAAPQADARCALSYQRRLVPLVSVDDICTAELQTRLPQDQEPHETPAFASLLIAGRTIYGDILP